MIKTVPITENRDFMRLYKKGKSFVSSAVVLYIIKNKKKKNRMGITTSKKIGKAVQRNRARRIIREAYRSLEPSTGDGWDFVFVARGKTPGLKTDEITKIMRGMFMNAGVIAK